MPKPAQAEKNETPVEILAEEKVTPQPSPVIEVDAGTGQPVSQKPSEPTVSAEEFRKMQARYEYQARQFERSQREMQEKLEAMRQAPKPVVHAEKPSEGDVYGYSKEELNALGEKDWTKPVQMMAERIAERKAEEFIKKHLAEQEKVQSERIRQQTTLNTLEREKQWVLEQEPSLNDETSDEFRGFYATYNRLVQEDPTLLQNPRAPRLVYREWKAEAGSTGRKDSNDPEKERLKRVAAGVAPQGRPSSPKTIKLTQDEVDFCKNKGISPAVYASMKDANLKEGVSA